MGTSLVSLELSIKPKGLVTFIDGTIAKIWVFPRNIFPAKEIEIDFNGKLVLRVGDWVFLKQDSYGIYRYKMIYDMDQVPLESSVGPSGDVEVKGRVIFGKPGIVDSSLKSFAVWSPDIGVIGAFFNYEAYPESNVYQATFRRVAKSKKSKIFPFDWAVIYKRPIDLIGHFHQNSLNIALKDRNVRIRAIAIQQTNDYYDVWSRLGKIARIQKNGYRLKLGEWIEYYDILTEFGGAPPYINEYAVIDPPLATVFENGVVKVKIGSSAEDLSLFYELVGRIQGSGVCAYWNGKSWSMVPDPKDQLDLANNEKALSPACTMNFRPSESINSTTSFFTSRNRSRAGTDNINKSINSASSLIGADENVYRLPTFNATQQNKTLTNGVVLMDRNTKQLVICPLKGHPFIFLGQSIFNDGTSMNLGDGVSVLTEYDSFTEQLIPVEAPGKYTQITSRIGHDGSVEIRTCISNIRVEDYTTYGDSSELGKVKDIYDVLPHGNQTYIVWCTHVPSDGCYWALAKGEPVFNEKEWEKSGSACPQTPPAFIAEDYPADQLCASGYQHPYGAHRDKYGTGKPSPEEFIASVRKIVSNKEIQGTIYKANSSLFVELISLLG